MTKKWWESSTIWVNIVPILLLVLDYFIRSSNDSDLILLLTAVVNIINRLRIKQPTEVLPLTR